MKRNCHKSFNIEISQELKVGNCWRGRKMSLKMLSTEWTSCNLLPQLGKLPNCKQTFVDGKSKEKFVLGKEENSFFQKRWKSHELNVTIIQKTNKQKKKTKKQKKNCRSVSYLAQISKSSE